MCRPILNALVHPPYGIALILVSLLSVVTISPAYACSGGRPPTLGEVVEPAEIIVKAQVVEIDDAHLNGVLHVEQYLAGGPGPADLVLQQRSRPEYLVLGENRGGSGGCALIGPSIDSDETLYLFLIRNADGTYRNSLSPTQFNNDRLHYQFSGDPPTATIGEVDSQGEYQQRDVTESEFVALIAGLTGAAPTSPDPALPYPLPAPLLLQTASGQAYVLPVDGGPPYVPEGPLWRSQRRYLGQFVEGITACSTDCAILSEDGTAPVVKSGQDIQWGIPGNVTSGNAVGDAVMVSPTNDLIAVWNSDSLAVHFMNNPRVGINLLYMEPRPAPYNQVRLQGDQPVYRAAWSDDGRILAYSDDDGLWLWDVFAQGSSPRLLLPVLTKGVIPYARYWSPGGRYLAVAEGEHFGNYDTVEQKWLPDGIISPDDRVLMAFDTQAEGMTDLYFCRLAPEQPCNVPYGLQQIDSRYPPLWESATTYILRTCLENRGCLVLRDNTFLLAFSATLPGLAFDLEPASQTLVTIDQDQMLHIFNLDSLPLQPRIIPIPGDVSDEITSVEWLPSPLIMLAGYP